MSFKSLVYLFLTINLLQSSQAGKEFSPEKPTLIEEVQALEYFILPKSDIKGLTAEEAINKICKQANVTLTQKNSGGKSIQWKFQLFKGGHTMLRNLENTRFIDTLKIISQSCGQELTIDGLTCDRYF